MGPTFENLAESEFFFFFFYNFQNDLSYIVQIFWNILLSFFYFYFFFRNWNLWTVRLSS